MTPAMLLLIAGLFWPTRYLSKAFGLTPEGGAGYGPPGTSGAFLREEGSPDYILREDGSYMMREA